MSEPRIDVQVEHRHAPPPSDAKHPNTCPKCGSHYRDDELDGSLWVCTHCGHHFPMRARTRTAWYADQGASLPSIAELAPHELLARPFMVTTDRERGR